MKEMLVEESGEMLIPLHDSPGRHMSAYYSAPERPAPFPGVVIIHEMFGLNDNIRDITRRFAAAGYFGLAVDLFSGRNRMICLARLLHGLILSPIKNGVVGDLQSALDTLRRRQGVDPERVGVIGFCLGGSYALQLACVTGEMRAAAVFYGQNPRPLEAVTKACPIVGSYPEQDFTAQAGRKLDAMLKSVDVIHDIKIYPGARHSFFNNRGSAYDEEAAADAWRRTVSFFDQHLAISE